MKQQLDMKRLILLNLPYVFAFYFVDKVAAVFRLAPGSAFVEKLTGGFANFGTAFCQSAAQLPSDGSAGRRGGRDCCSSWPSTSREKTGRNFAKERNTGQPVGGDRKTSGLTWMTTSPTMSSSPRPRG